MVTSTYSLCRSGRRHRTDHNRWVPSKDDFLLPIPALRKVFRGKFLAGLKRLREHRKLCCNGPARVLADSKQFAKLLRRLHLRRWVVYAKAPFVDVIARPDMTAESVPSSGRCAHSRV
jgi:Putative transposase